MESIRQALERSRTLKGGSPQAGNPSRGRVGNFADPLGRAIQACALDKLHLNANRIIAHDETDPRARSFDMLRTQVLQTMDHQNWKVLGVTSPSQGCGKTVTAVNLTFSIARQPERSALLIDLDLQKPQVAKTLGVHVTSGVLDVLDDRTSVSSAVVGARAGSCPAMVLPTERPASDSSALITSRAMTGMLQDIKRDYQSSIIIIDLPPMLAGDDVIALLPQLDCVLLVAAAGKTTPAEIQECNKHLQSTEVVRLVLNKAPERSAQYYYY